MYLKSYNRDKRVQSLSRGEGPMWGRGQRNKVMKYGEGPRRVRCPWAQNDLATPLHDMDYFRQGFMFEN